MKKIFLISLMALGMVSCDDFLTKDPLASFQDDDFWCNENNVRGYAMGYYAARFPGYGSGDSGGVMSQRQALNDDFTNTTLSGFASGLSILFIATIIGIPADLAWFIASIV